MLTNEQIIQIIDLITIAGKSSETGTEGLLKAAQAISWLFVEAQLLENAQRAPSESITTEPSATINT